MQPNENLIAISNKYAFIDERISSYERSFRSELLDVVGSSF